MLNAALLIARKDLTLLIGRRSAGFMQSILLGLLLIFLFSLSTGIGERMTPQAATAIFWMATCFCQVLIFNGLYNLEESHGQRVALLLTPIAIQAVWLGKALAALLLIILAQLLFIPAIVVFLAQEISQYWYYALAIIAIADIGTVALGSLLGALSQGHSGRESLFSIIIFPLLIPLFLAGIHVGQCALSSAPPLDMQQWFGMALAFDAIFMAAGLLLFPYIFTAEN